jgi:transcriptional regulator with XRE-family HTH domain
MDAAEILQQVLERSGMSKSQLCARAQISRSTLDEYLRGKKQPAYAQLVRIADAAGMQLSVSVAPRRRAMPEQFRLVLEFGEMFPRKEREPLVDLSPIWRRAAS